MRRRFVTKIGMLFLVFCLLASCATSPLIPAASFSDQPKQSASDWRHYRALTLDNGLKVLLIQDERTDLASVSMNVFTGSGSDPVAHQGLAHFLEHMLFLGSEAYPEAQDFQQFIQSQGGQHNAYTALDQTHYFFTVNPDALNPALARFAHFFIDPLLDARYIEQEKHAVHAEYQARLRDEYRRKQDVLQTLMIEDSPQAKFSVGSLQSLAGEGHVLRKELLAFYQHYYVANNMALVVLDTQSLDSLEQQVRSLFSAVREDAQFIAPTWPENPFAEEILPRIVQIQPEKTIHELNLLFPLPALRRDGANESALLGYILGYEGEGSLHAYLKQRGWIEYLSAGFAWAHKDGSAFSMQIGLTTKGMQAQEEVLQAVFATIHYLQQNPNVQPIYKEIQQTQQLAFESNDNNAPLERVMAAANAMQYYAQAHWLDAPYYFAPFNAERWQALLHRLTVDNVLLISVGDTFVADQVSPYFAAPYKQLPLPKAWHENLQQAKPIKEIHLPKVNPFIAENLQLIPATTQEKPQMIAHTEQAVVWYHGLQQFQQPQAENRISYLYQKPFTGQQTVLLSLYAAMLEESVNALTYPAEMAQLSFSLYPHMRGLTLSIAGFSDKQTQLFAAIMQNFNQLEMTQAQFARIQTQLLKQLDNGQKNPPYQQVGRILTQLSFVPYASYAEKRAWLAQADLAQLKAFAKEFRQHAFVRILSNGNMSPAHALQLRDSAVTWVQSSTETAPALTVKTLTNKQSYVLESAHDDALYALYWQAKDISVQTQLQWMLLAQLLEVPFFNEMRTEKQLGYVVFARYQPLLTLPGILYLVQSPSADVVTLEKTIQTWLAEQLAQLAQVDETQFNTAKAALLQQLTEKPKSLTEQTARFWYELALGEQYFLQNETLAKALMLQDRQTWQLFVQTLATESAKTQMKIVSGSKAEILQYAGEKTAKKVYIYEK